MIHTHGKRTQMTLKSNPEQEQNNCPGILFKIYQMLFKILMIKV